MKPLGNRRSTALALCAMLAALANGCASRGKYEINEEILAPKPPAFLTGPAAVLLTNANDFSARLTLEPPADAPKSKAKAKPFTGLLLGQGNRLLFNATGSDRTFVWDASEHKGYIFSEALQGYAPISSPIGVTNVSIVSETAGSSGDKVNGHRGHEAEIAVASTDGSVVKFSLWRAADLKGYPVRVKSLNAPVPFAIDLAAFRQEKLPARLFQPPEGFTAYPSAEAMTSEIVMRKAKLRSAPNDKPADVTPMPSPGIRNF